MRRRRATSSCFRRVRLGDEEVIVEYRPSRWMLVVIAVPPAIPLSLPVVFPRDGHSRWLPIVIYVLIVALLWTCCLRGQLSLTRDALFWRVFRTECLTRADLRYGTLAAYGSVELVAISDETRTVLGPVGYPFDKRNRRVCAAINAWAGTREPDPPPAPAPPVHDWSHRTRRDPP